MLPHPGRAAFGVLCILVSATCYGAMPIFAEFAYQRGADVRAVLLIRFAVAGIVLAILMRATSTTWPRGRDLRLLILMGAIGYVGQSFTYFSALTLIPPGLASVLYYTYPALVAICVAVAARRLPSVITALSIGIATVGVGLVVGPQPASDVGGIVLALADAVIYTGCIMAGSRVLSSTSPLATTTVVCLAAASVYGAVALADPPSLPNGAVGWLAALATALISTVVAITAFFAGLRVLGPAPSAGLSTVEPVITVLLAFAFLGERFTWVQAGGIGLICVSVTTIAVTGARRGGEPARSRRTTGTPQPGSFRQHAKGHTDDRA
jgi:drug/metabolite transporter (DMT)-like permease